MVMVMDIYVNEQSSIRIVENNIVIYFDPYNINDKKMDANYIFITHPHYDHYDIKSINNIKNDKTKIIAPKSCTNKIDADIYLDFGVNKVDDLDIIVKEAYNINKDFHKKEYNWVGYIIKFFDKYIYVMGDTDIIEDKLDIKIDYLFIPIGGTYTCNYIEAANFTNLIKPINVIPTHYGTIVGNTNLGNKFKELLDKDIICNNNIL